MSKISNTSLKSRADKLSKMFKKDRKDFENKWDDVKVFIEYGMLTDQTFFQKEVNSALYKTTKVNILL